MLVVPVLWVWTEVDVKWIGGMEVVVGDVGYGFELGTQVVDSKWNFCSLR